MSFEYILCETKNNILYITINRPDKLNALNTRLLQEIKEAVESVQNDNSVYGILLTGSGDKAFAAGADIAEFAEFSPQQGEHMSAEGHAVMNALEQSIKPTVAVVKGFALGGGCELAIACHMRVAADNAKFGLPEVNLGLIPGYGATQRIPILVGRAKGMELLMTGAMIGADEALSLGLVNYVESTADAITKAEELIHKTASKSPQAIASVVKCVHMLYQNPSEGMKTEQQLFGERFQTSDFTEGTDAFLNKRKANFHND
jgi:enoyl-CoA hydratase